MPLNALKASGATPTESPTEKPVDWQIVRRDLAGKAVTVQIGKGDDARRVNIKGVPSTGAYFLQD